MPENKEPIEKKFRLRLMWQYPAEYLDIYGTETLEQSYKKSVEANPGDPSIHSKAGDRYCDLVGYERNAGTWDSEKIRLCFDKAGECYERALEVDPNNILTLHNLGIVCAEKGDFEKAKNWLEKVLTCDSKKMLAKANLGIIYARQGNLEEAIKWLEKAVEFDLPEPITPNAVTETAFTYEALAAVYKAAGMNENAQECIETSVKRIKKAISKIN